MTLDETFKAAKAGDLTNDTTYKVGEISRKTGLQKQPDGSWAPPKKTNYGKVTTNKNGEVGIQQTLGKGSKFEKFGSEKEAARALGNYTAGYNTTERSKENPHSDEARLHNHWNKETEKIAKENKQNKMKSEVLEYLSHTMAKEKAEAFLDAAEPKMLRTMYNNLKYKIPGENKKLHEAEPAASEEPDPILSEKDLHSIYMDIKNNELEDFSTEQIQKEYKITRGDAAAIKARIDNNKRAREQDRRERSSQDAACTAESVNAPRENLERKLTGDCKIRIRK